MNSHQYRWLDHEAGNYDDCDPRDFQLGAPVVARRHSDRGTYEAFSLLGSAYNEEFDRDDGTESDDAESDYDEDEKHGLGSGTDAGQRTAMLQTPLGSKVQRTPSSLASLEAAEEGVLDAALKMRRRVKGLASKRRGLLAGGAFFAGVLLVGLAWRLSPWGQSPRFSKSNLVNLEGAASTTLPPTSPPTNTPAFAVEAVHASHPLDWLTGGIVLGTMYLDSGVPMLWSIYQHDDDFVFESASYRGHFLSYDEMGTVSFKEYSSVPSAPKFKLKPWRHGVLGEFLITTAAHTALGSESYLGHDSTGGVSLQTDMFNKQLWRIPNFPMSEEKCLTNTTVSNDVFKCSDYSLCTGEACCIEKGSTTIQCPPNLPVLCFGIHCNSRTYGKDRCCAASEAACRVNAGGAAECQVQPNCTGFACPAGQSLKPSPEMIKCAGYNCTDADTGVCCKVDIIDPLSPVLSKNVFVDESTSVQRGGFIYPRVEARLRDGDQVQFESAANGNFLKVLWQAVTEARGSIILTSQSGMACQDGGSAVTCSSSPSPDNLFEVADSAYHGSWQLAGSVSFKSARSAKYCKDTGVSIVCDSPNVSGTSTFNLEDGGDDTLCVKSDRDNMYCRVREQYDYTRRGKARLKRLKAFGSGNSSRYEYCSDRSIDYRSAGISCEVVSADHGTVFDVGSTHGLWHNQVSLLSSVFKYCSADETYGVRCDRGTAGQGEDFQLVHDDATGKLLLKSYLKGKFCATRLASIVTLRGNVSLRASNERLCVDQGPGRPMACDVLHFTEKFLSQEDFEILDSEGSEYVSIRGNSAGLYCGHTEVGITCNKAKPSISEVFQIVDAGGSSFALKSNQTGKFCSIDEQQIFTMRGPSIAMKSASSGKFCADRVFQEQPQAVVCESTEAGSDEKFEIVDGGNDFNDFDQASLIGSKTKNYCRDLPKGVVCDQDLASPPSAGWTAFTVVDALDGMFALRGARLSKYCVVKTQPLLTMEGSFIFTTHRQRSWRAQGDQVVLSFSGNASHFLVIDAANSSDGMLKHIVSGPSGKFCSDTHTGLTCTESTAWTEMETFSIVDAGDGKVGFKGRRAGKYCGVARENVLDMRGEIKVKSIFGKFCSPSVSVVECQLIRFSDSFMVEDTPLGKTFVTLSEKTSGAYCSDKPEGMKCNVHANASEFETFEMLDIGSGKFALKGARLGKFCGVRQETAKDVEGGFPIFSGGTGHLCRFHKSRILCDTRPGESISDGEKLFLSKSSQDGATILATKAGACAEQLLQHMGTLYNLGVTCIPGTNTPGFKFNQVGEGRYSMQSSISGRYCGTVTQTYAHMRGPNIIVKSESTGQACSYQLGVLRCLKSASALQWEVLAVEDLGSNNTVAFRAGRQMLYCNDSPKGITCDGSSPTAASEFQLFDRPDGQFAIRGRFSGKYCGVEALPLEELAGKGIQIISITTGKPCGDLADQRKGTQAPIQCNVSASEEKGAHSMFEIQDVGSGRVSIKSDTGQYCSNTEIGLVCMSKTAGTKESFNITDAGDGLFALRGHTGKYCVMAEQTVNMVQGKGITLRANGGGYCSDLPGSIKCETESSDTAEVFKIEQVDPVKNVVTIQGGRQNKFCSDRHRGVSCSADAPDKWEMFTVEYVGSDTVALKGGRLGKYCAVNPAPVLDMRGEEISFKSVANGMFCSDLYNGVFCRSNKVQSSETYVVSEVGPREVSLRGSKQGKYCSDEEVGLICNSDSAGGNSTFRIVDANDGYFALRGARAGKYCAIKDESITHFHGERITLTRSKTGNYCTDFYGKIICKETKATDWEHFTVASNGFGEVRLRGRREGKYCSDKPEGVVCDADHALSWEAFKVIDAGHNKIKLVGGRVQGYCTMKPEPATKVQGRIQLKNKFTGKFCKMALGVMTCQGKKSKIVVDSISGIDGARSSLLSGDTEKYCADTEKGITCKSDKREDWEAFQLEDVGGKLALRGGRSGKYCAVKNQSIVEMRGRISMVSVSNGKTCMDQSDGISCLVDDPPEATTFFELETLFEGQGGFVVLRDLKGMYCSDEPEGIRCQAEDARKWEFFKINAEADGLFSLTGNRLGKKCGIKGDRIVCDVDDEPTGDFAMLATPASARFKQHGWTPDIQVACDQDEVTDKAVFDIHGWVPDDKLICDNSTTAEEAESFVQGGWLPMQQIICDRDNVLDAAKFQPHGWKAERIFRCDYEQSEMGTFQIGGWTPPWNIKCDADAPADGEFPDSYKFAQIGWNADSRIVCNRDSDEAPSSIFEGVNWAPGNVIICNANAPSGNNFLYSFQGWRKDAPMVCDFESLEDNRTHFEPVGWAPDEVIACNHDTVQGFEVSGWQPEQRLICDSDNITEAAKFMPVGWHIESRIFCESDFLNSTAKFKPVGPDNVLLKDRIICDADHNDSNILSVEFDDSMSPAETLLVCDYDACDSDEAKFKPTGWTASNSLVQTALKSEASNFSVERPHPASSDVAFLCLDVVPVRYMQASNPYDLKCTGMAPHYFQYERVADWNSEWGYLKRDDKYLTVDVKGKHVTFEADAASGHESIKIHMLGGYETVRPLVRGVNLGNWLLLERWMSEDMFVNATGQKFKEVCTAIDEYGLMAVLGPAAKDRMEAHWSTWITETDIAWIADHGLNAVRIPFGYWIVKPEAPFVEGGFKYLKKVVKWCEDHKVGFLLDFHGLKGSQQGSVSSGNCGGCGITDAWCGDTWVKFLEHQAVNLEVISIVSKHFANSSMFLGFEVANDVSDGVNSTKCMAFYQKAYDIIRGSNPTAPVYLSKTFNPSTYPWPNFDEVVVDDHLYYKSPFGGASGDLHHNLELARKRLMSSSNMAVSVGEWALDDHGSGSDAYSVTAKDVRYKEFAKMQLQAFEQYSTGWYYWTYKTQSRNSTWNYVDMCANGILPGCTGDYNFTAQPWWKTPSCAFAYLDGTCDKTQSLEPAYVAGSWVATAGYTKTGKVYKLSQVGNSLYSEVGSQNVSGTISSDDAKISMFNLTGLLEGKMIKWSNGEHWLKTA